MTGMDRGQGRGNTPGAAAPRAGAERTGHVAAKPMLPKPAAAAIIVFSAR